MTPLLASPQNDDTPIFMYDTLFYNFFFLAFLKSTTGGFSLVHNLWDLGCPMY